jgi:predicted esterase
LDPAVTTVLTPRGPIETGAGPAWFEDGSDLGATLEDLDEVIDAAGRERAAVVVGGFSQGAAVALALALHRTDRSPMAGAFAIDGYLLPPGDVDYDFARAASTAVLLSHGADDEVVPVRQGRSAARVLERGGVPVQFREHDGLGHELAPAFLADVRAWLAELTR